MKIATLVIRYLTGAFLLVFGSNKFFQFMPQPEITDPLIIGYFTALMTSKTLLLVGIVEILAGLALLTNAFVPLALVVLMPVSVNIIWFHLILDPANIAGGLMLFAFNVFLILANKDVYKELLKIR